MNETTTELVDKALALLEKPMEAKPTNEYHTYHLEVPDEIHWVLVALGAGNKQHHEDYAEKVLIEYVALCYDKMVDLDTDDKQEIA